jgi:hypothetical protein
MGILNLDIKAGVSRNTRALLDSFQRVVIHRRRELMGDGGFFSMEELDRLYGKLVVALTHAREEEIADRAEVLLAALQLSDDSWQAAEGALLAEQKVDRRKVRTELEELPL